MSDEPEPSLFVRLYYDELGALFGGIQIMMSTPVIDLIHCHRFGAEIPTGSGPR